HRLTVEARTVLRFTAMPQDGAPPPRAGHVLIAAPIATGGPPASSGAAMAIFGGRGGPGVGPALLDDTWAASLDDGAARWRRVEPPEHPTARADAATAVDTASSRAFVIGGADEAGI